MPLGIFLQGRVRSLTRPIHS